MYKQTVVLYISFLCLLVEADDIRTDFDKLLNQQITAINLSRPFNSSEIKFLLYKPELKNYTILDNADIDAQAVTVFILHGWNSKPNDSWILELSDVYSNSTEEKYNVIIVDWSQPASELYSIAARYMEPLGSKIAQKIINLHEDQGLSLDNFIVIGFSLAAHAAGTTAMSVYNRTTVKIKEVIGLDPSGPLFYDNVYRLKPGYAQLVIAFHTDMGTLGTTLTSGNIDLYANGGTPPQPGCLVMDLLSLQTLCSHVRAAQLLVAVLQNPRKFSFTQCSSKFLYDFYFCHNNQELFWNELSTNITGTFYFNTTYKAPFFKQ